MAKREMKNTKDVEHKVDEKIEETTTNTSEEVQETVPCAYEGIVTGCTKLNVRKKPDLKADPVTVLDVKTKVTVYPDDSIKDWYKVTVGKSVKGFCMKKYVTIDN